MSKKTITPQGIKSVGPYSPAVNVGNMLFLSGQIGLIEGKIPKEFKDEATNAIQNALILVENAGFDKKNIVKVEIYLKDIRNYPLLNEIYSKFIPSPFPARVVVEVSNLPKNANIEISMIAVK